MNLLKVLWFTDVIFSNFLLGAFLVVAWTGFAFFSVFTLSSVHGIVDGWEACLGWWVTHVANIIYQTHIKHKNY